MQTCVNNSCDARSVVIVSLNSATAQFTVVNAGLGMNWSGELFGGSYTSWYFENGRWQAAGNSGSVGTVGVQLGAEFNAPQPPTDTCGSPLNPPKNLGPPVCPTNHLWE
jgi:hypothetical protein